MKISIVLIISSLTFFGCKTTNTPCVGKPIEDCMCTQQYQPVCGCDGKTYGNACAARCAGVKSTVEGECK